jgi:Putative Flp pilus-assembly TadE/G-like
MQANLRLGWPVAQGRRRQRGQALIYGLFMLVAGLASMFFLFNAGQLTREKSKLVGTADAVAYSASIMHARALNFAAYTTGRSWLMRSRLRKS